LSKAWNNIKSNKNSFIKFNRVPVPKYDVPPQPSGGHAVTIVAWPSSASIMISATGILPPVITSTETEALEGIDNAYHDPGVLDIRRRILVLDFIEAFFARDRKVRKIS
jgi:hypothetical protein